MGGLATHIAAERYGNRFDGALGALWRSRVTPGLTTTTDFFVAAAYVAGVTQAEFDADPEHRATDPTAHPPGAARRQAHARFENIMIDLTGGPRLRPRGLPPRRRDELAPRRHGRWGAPRAEAQRALSAWSEQRGEHRRLQPTGDPTAHQRRLSSPLHGGQRSHREPRDPAADDAQHWRRTGPDEPSADAS